MSRKLAVNVHVHLEDGSTVVYEAGSTPDAADAKRISNPDVWANEKPAEKSPK